MQSNTGEEAIRKEPQANDEQYPNLEPNQNRKNQSFRELPITSLWGLTEPQKSYFMPSSHRSYSNGVNLQR